MRKTKILAGVVLSFFLATFLQSQSLADLAKKEKERRQALKGKGATVVTNAELAKVKKRAAVETASQEQAPEGETGQAAEAAAGQGKPPDQASQAATPDEKAAAADKAAEETPPAENAPMTEKEFQAKQNELLKAATEKQEMVDLLTLKLNSLYQQFYGLDNLKSREVIQIQISDTYDKLLKAEAEANKAKKDIEDFVAKTKRENVPNLWIR